MQKRFSDWQSFWIPFSKATFPRRESFLKLLNILISCSASYLPSESLWSIIFGVISNGTTSVNKSALQGTSPGLFKTGPTFFKFGRSTLKRSSQNVLLDVSSTCKCALWSTINGLNFMGFFCEFCLNQKLFNSFCSIIIFYVYHPLNSCL